MELPLLQSCSGTALGRGALFGKAILTGVGKNFSAYGIVWAIILIIILLIVASIIVAPKLVYRKRKQVIEKKLAPLEGGYREGMIKKENYKKTKEGLERLIRQSR